MSQAEQSFATVDDLQARWRAFDEQEKPRVCVLLEDASDMIRGACPLWQGVAPSTLRRICCQVVRRVLQNEQQGVKQFTQSAGPYTETLAFANPDGDLYLTMQEKRALGVGRARGFSVTLTGQGEDAA